MTYVVIGTMRDSKHVARFEFGSHRAAIMHKLWLERQGYTVEVHLV